MSASLASSDGHAHLQVCAHTRVASKVQRRPNSLSSTCWCRRLNGRWRSMAQDCMREVTLGGQPAAHRRPIMPKALVPSLALLALAGSGSTAGAERLRLYLTRFPSSALAFQPLRRAPGLHRGFPVGASAQPRGGGFDPLVLAARRRASHRCIAASAIQAAAVGARRLACSSAPEQIERAQTLTVTTWNVNSVRQRLDNVRRYLQEHSPDVLALQETKCMDKDFPRAALEELGYHVVFAGQKSYNGVALVSRHPISDVITDLPGAKEDPFEPQARFIQGVVCGVCVCNVYVPNGNPVDSDKFEYRQRFMSRLIGHIGNTFVGQERLTSHMPFVVLGDFNCVQRDEDCFDPDAMRADAVMHPSSRSQFQQLVYLAGLYNAIDLHGARGTGVGRKWTYWDYRAGSWDKGHGIRIDHILLHPTLADGLEASGVHAATRGWPVPSDHAPVWARLRL